MSCFQIDDYHFLKVQSSFFAHFMCFEVPALVPPGGAANGSKSRNEDSSNDDDLGIMDIDDDVDDGKSGIFFYFNFVFLWPVNIVSA